MADFDIHEEVNAKFLSTVVVYDKKAALVKAVTAKPAGKFWLQLAQIGTRSLKDVSVSDPALNYKNYQIGYVNGGQFCSWWYRKPHKQWQQGLKSNQMGYKLSVPGMGAHDHFSFTKPFTNMLEGIYPDIEAVKKSLLEGNNKALAFHRDFALSYDDVHDDFVLEYHGIKIGASIDRELKQFKIMAEARHLIEALQEARNVHA